MQNPTHGAIFTEYEEGSLLEEKVTGKCFVSSGADKSPMNSKVRTLLESFSIHFSSYDAIMSNFDNTYLALMT